MAPFGHLICFRKRRESYSSKANRAVVWKRDSMQTTSRAYERQHKILVEQWNRQVASICNVWCIITPGSAAFRDLQQTISDLLPESHGCFGRGWVEFLLVATHQYLINRCFGCEDWYSRGLVGSWKHFCSQKLWSKPPPCRPKWKASLKKALKIHQSLASARGLASPAEQCYKERSLGMTYFKPLWFGT